MKQKSSVDQYKEQYKEQKQNQYQSKGNSNSQQQGEDFTLKIAYFICFVLAFSAGSILFYYGQLYLPQYIENVDKKILNVPAWRAGLKFMIFYKFAYLSGLCLFLCLFAISLSRIFLKQINPYSNRKSNSQSKKSNFALNTVEDLNVVNQRSIQLVVIFNILLFAWFNNSQEPGNVVKIFTTVILFNFGIGGTFFSEFLGQFIKVPTQDIFGQTLTYLSFITMACETFGYSLYPYFN